MSESQKSTTPATASASVSAIVMKEPNQPLGEFMADAPITSEPPTVPVIEGKLTPEQAKVLQQIMSGKSIVSAAQTAGVSRSTVYRWQSDDPHYIAALNAWKQQTQESVRNRLLAMSDRAVVAINNALLTCDARTAMSLLKGLGLLSPVQQSSPDPDLVRRQIELDTWRGTVQLDEQSKDLRLREKQAKSTF